MSDSIWKKEISFKKKSKPAPEPDEAAAAPEPKQSFLKKEISFGRKAKPSKLEPELDDPKQSFLKKEISFGRKKQEKTVEQLTAEVERVFAVPDPEPVALPTEIAEATLAAMPDPAAYAAPEPVVEPPPLPQYGGLSPAIVAATADEAPAFQLPPPLPEPTPAAGVEPVAYEPLAYEPLPVEPEVPQAEPAPVEAVPVEAVPVEPALVESALVEPALEEPASVEAAPVVESWLAQPELPPEPKAPAPVVLHPPVPAAELGPVLEPSVPFWKRDLSLSRGAKKPKQPKAPKEAKAPKESNGSFLRKELSFGKKKDEPAAAEAPTATMPAAPKGSFLRRDLALSFPKLSRPSVGGKGSGHGVKRYVGLKIGASQLAAARVANNGSAELLQVAREPLAQGVVVAGELREPDALADALKTFFARHKLPRKNVRLGIASNRIGVRIIELVGIDDDKQLGNAVQFRAQEALPIPLDEAVLDYRVLESSSDAEGRPVKKVMLVVAYRDLVDRYIGACRKAGIGLAGIDLEAFALLRALEEPHDRSDAATVAVSIGHDRSTFAVTDGRVCRFTRVLEWGGFSINRALAQVLNMTPSQCEEFKHRMSLDTNMVIEGLSAEQSAAALDAVRKQLQLFGRELVSSLQFYQNQPESLAFGSIVITGGSAHLPGLAVELERLTGVRVQIGDPLARVKVAKKVATPEQIGSLAVAIGLGIED